jgi:putative sigma-54 modulation protein
MRDYAEGKIRRLDRHFDRIIDARLELAPAGRHSIDPEKVAQLQVHLPGSVLKGSVTARGIREAVDLVVDKLDEQLRRRKERIQDHHRPKGVARGAQQA